MYGLEHSMDCSFLHIHASCVFRTGKMSVSYLSRQVASLQLPTFVAPFFQARLNAHLMSEGNIKAAKYRLVQFVETYLTCTAPNNSPC